MSENNNKLFARSLICCLIFMLPFLFQGCASRHLSEDFGQSYEAMRYAQVVNPKAPKDNTPVDGCPGEVAGKIYSEFKNSYGEEMSLAEQVGNMVLGN